MGHKKRPHKPPQAISQNGDGADGAANGIGFLPPGAKLARDRRNEFANQFEHHFEIPNRIARVPNALVEAVNDFHYAMMNDTPRNEFYYQLLKSSIVPGVTGVLEIGAGSGLLSMMAASLGAKWVVAVEGSPEMALLAQQNVAANNLSDRVRVLNMMSTDLTVNILPGKPDVLVSEIFGTLLLGESALDYIADVRRRVLPSPCRIIPSTGVQYAVMIECPTLDSVCSIQSWNGLNLQHVNAIKDTCSSVFTKKFGFRMSSVPYQELCEPIPVVSVDFCRDSPGFLPLVRTLRVKATRTGVAHAMLLFWKAEDEGLVMSTNPRETLNNFPRDMQWGQALQLLDADPSAKLPQAVHVQEGKEYDVECRLSQDSVLLQFSVRNLLTDPAGRLPLAPSAPSATGGAC